MSKIHEMSSRIVINDKNSKLENVLNRTIKLLYIKGIFKS